MASITLWKRRIEKPEVRASPSSTDNSKKGRRPIKAIRPTTTRAHSCKSKSERLTPSSSPNKMRVRSPTNASLREVMMTPSASMPTKSKPIAVSPERRKRRVTRLTPPIITTAPTAAPTMPDTPRSSAVAMPGRTPCASASPTNASPRSTTKVPAMAHVIATRMPATKARRRNSLFRNGSMNMLGFSRALLQFG